VIRFVRLKQVCDKEFLMRDPKHIIADSNKVLVKTYTPQPVVMSHGAGVYVWDSEGRKYLDFAAGIAVASLGHAHPKMVETISTQAARLMAVQASYMTEEKLKCAQLLIDHSGLDLVYFANSGTETIEGAIKMARKWAYDHKHEKAHELIAFRQSFHGRTMGAASLTEKAHVQPFFAPYLPGVHFATFNDIDSVKACVNENTAAIFLEPVQGEGGLVPADPAFLKALRTLCTQEHIALVYDEVQAGMGRMGTLFAHQAFGADADVMPDIACIAKGMGGGFPVGAIVAKRKFADAIVPGTHGTTYGGNPLACAVAGTVIGELLHGGFFENVQKTSAYFFNGLKTLQRESNKIEDIRGKGLMVGVDTTLDIQVLLRHLQKNGLMATRAGKKTLRLTPPLIVNTSHIDEALEILQTTLCELD
jgi:acetylornithine/N-succinyldiaminopimelate aminotransferase